MRVLTCESAASHRLALRRLSGDALYLRGLFLLRRAAMLARRDESRSIIESPHPLVAGHLSLCCDACRCRLGADASGLAFPETQSNHRAGRDRRRDIAASVVDFFLARAESSSPVRHLRIDWIGCGLRGVVPGARGKWRFDAACRIPLDEARVAASSDCETRFSPFPT